MIEIQLDTIRDDGARDALRKVVEALNAKTFLKGSWQFIEFTTKAGALTNAKYNHQLGFKPKDVLLLSTTGGATVTWNYTSFTSTIISATTSAATTVRAFIGTYREG